MNSYAHIFGNKPYDQFIKPTESYTVALLAFGEGEEYILLDFYSKKKFTFCTGWHNYHHTFPYDYKTSEHDKYWCNFTTGFLEAMAWLGEQGGLKGFFKNKILNKIAMQLKQTNFRA